MNKLTIGIEIINKLNTLGYDAYIVGGAVRDYLLNLEPTDVDITTNATVSELEKIFKVSSKTGENFQGLTVNMRNVDFEITTFRRDVKYIDHRHPITEIAKDLEEDLKRRDFTINAMAMDAKYEIIDIYNGKEDLNKKIIRTIRSADVRFNEDGLRVLRAIHYAARFNFNLDDDIINSFKNDYLKYLPEEYIINMLDKIMPYEKGLYYLNEYKLFRSFPFYQVVVDEAYENCLRQDIYALFYLNHNFFPSNIKLNKQIQKEAKDIAFLVTNDFNNESLYYGNEKCFIKAIALYNSLNKTNINVEDILNKKANLLIKSHKDINFDFTVLKPNLRGYYIKKVELAIINGLIKNDFPQIKKYLELED